MPHSLLCSQASKLPDHHTAQQPTETSSNSSMAQFPSTSSSTTQQMLTQDLPQPLPQVQAQSADRSPPPHLTSTLEHIVGQLDILTQVRTMGVFSHFYRFSSAVCETLDHFLAVPLVVL